MFIGSYENMQKLSLRIRQAAIDLGVKRMFLVSVAMRGVLRIHS